MFGNPHVYTGPMNDGLVFTDNLPYEICFHGHEPQVTKAVAVTAAMLEQAWNYRRGGLSMMNTGSA